MTLDKLYSVIKKSKFPIRDRDQLMHSIGENKFYFEGHVFDAEEIAVHITKYPIRNVADFFRDFFEEELDAYNLDEAKSLGLFEARVEP